MSIGVTHRKIEDILDLQSVYDMLSLKGKTALVTGGSGGIGRSTSAAMAELGAKVMLMDLPSRESQLQKAVADIKQRYMAECDYVLGDVRDVESIEAFVEKTAERFGTIDILHNNAGIGIAGDNADITKDAWDNIVAINLTGPMFVAQAVADKMKSNPAGGSIVTTASMSGIIVNTGPGYAATKAGVLHMTNALAIALAVDNIRCNSVCYGYILSGMHENPSSDPVRLEHTYSRFEETTPMKRCGTLSEVVGCVVYLASDLGRFTTGSAIVVDGGFSIQ
ncbi:MAG: SDR family oxidoreductase [Oscillospiraceae bacterium]|nr:SDR family oxidoreductase [Oscillospiraceae bacterium]